jgi:hypothetical protein
MVALLYQCRRSARKKRAVRYLETSGSETEASAARGAPMPAPLPTNEPRADAALLGMATEQQILGRS